MDSKKLLKSIFKKAILKFGTIMTDKGELIIEGDPEVGKEVLIDTENEMIAPIDGEYMTDTVKIKIENGVITEIENIETEEKPADNQEVNPAEVDAKKCEMEIDTENVPEHTEEKAPGDDKDAKIAELEQTIADKDAEIAELKNKITELEDKSNRPVEEPVQMAKMPKCFLNTDNPALKYFQD